MFFRHKKNRCDWIRTVERSTGPFHPLRPEFRSGRSRCFKFRHINKIRNRYLRHLFLILIDATGFEPAASASRTQRSTKLSHASICYGSTRAANIIIAVAGCPVNQYFKIVVFPGAITFPKKQLLPKRQGLYL